MIPIAQKYLASHLKAHKEKFAANPALPLMKILNADYIQPTLREFSIEFRHRLFTPLATIWTFITQTLDSDRSCRAAVARYICSMTVKEGSSRKPCSSATGSYCKARKRLPEALIEMLSKRVGNDLKTPRITRRTGPGKVAA